MRLLFGGDSIVQLLRTVGARTHTHARSLARTQ
jgi:hypothetical protein